MPRGSGLIRMGGTEGLCAAQLRAVEAALWRGAWHNARGWSSPGRNSLVLPTLLATRPFGLSLGDRLCLALAIREKPPALTADKAWADVAPLIGATVKLIR
jgi:hypothetical protein